MGQLEIDVIKAAKDNVKQEAIIIKYKPFILKCASDHSHRYITDADDEWIIALQAFIEAMNKYYADRGSFLSFAELVIKRRLIDYFNSNKKYRNEIPVSPSVFNGEFEDDEQDISIHVQVQEKITYMSDNRVVDEIKAINTVFQEYGFSFFDLAECSPKSGKTKNACTAAILFLLQSYIITNEIKRTKQLPIKIIENNTKVPRKILERHRRYIIAAVEILSGEYPCLAEYMYHIRKELNK